MPMLAGIVDVVIGVDTHKHTHAAAIVAAATGAQLAAATVPAASRQVIWPHLSS
jgi:transposase